MSSEGSMEVLPSTTEELVKQDGNLLVGPECDPATNSRVPELASGDNKFGPLRLDTNTGSQDLLSFNSGESSDQSPVTDVGHNVSFSLVNEKPAPLTTDHEDSDLKKSKELPLPDSASNDPFDNKPAPLRETDSPVTLVSF